MSTYFPPLPSGGNRVNHDCTLHHKSWPSADPYEHVRLLPFSYTAIVLREHSADVTTLPCTEGQLQHRHAFVGDYLAANTDEASYNELYAILSSWLRDIDTYFFGGNLLARPTPLVSLRLHETAPFNPNLYGSTEYSIAPGVRVIHINRTRARGNGKWSKISLLHTLVHESVHAYLETFHNSCWIDFDAVAGPLDDGHGWLFHAVLDETLDHISYWHEDLAPIIYPANPRTNDARFESWYIPQMGRLPFLKYEWESKDEFDERGLLRWPRESARLKRVFLRLEYGEYLNFVKTRVPRAMIAYRICWGLVVLAVLPMAWCYFTSGKSLAD